MTSQSESTLYRRSLRLYVCFSSRLQHANDVFCLTSSHTIRLETALKSIYIYALGGGSSVLVITIRRLLNIIISTFSQYSDFQPTWAYTILLSLL